MVLKKQKMGKHLKDIDKRTAETITQYFLNYWDVDDCSKKEIRDLEKEVYFMITTN